MDLDIRGTLFSCPHPSRDQISAEYPFGPIDGKGNCQPHHKFRLTTNAADDIYPRYMFFVQAWAVSDTPTLRRALRPRRRTSMDPADRGPSRTV